MGIIGVDDELLANNNHNIDNTAAQAMIASEAGAPFVYTCEANQEVFRAAYWIDGYAGDAAGVELGVFDITGGSEDGGVLVPGTLRTLGSMSAGWNIQDFTAQALTEGNLYTVARNVRSATNVRESFFYDNSGISLSTADGSVGLQTPWVHSGPSGAVPIMYFETQAASAPAENPGIRFDNCFDRTNSNALLADETAVTVHLWTGSFYNNGSLAAPDFTDVAEVTNGSAVLEIDSDLIGAVGATVSGIVVLSSGLMAPFTTTVIDLDA